MLEDMDGVLLSETRLRGLGTIRIVIRRVDLKRVLKPRSKPKSYVDVEKQRIGPISERAKKGGAHVTR